MKKVLIFLIIILAFILSSCFLFDEDNKEISKEGNKEDNIDNEYTDIFDEIINNRSDVYGKWGGGPFTKNFYHFDYNYSKYSIIIDQTHIITSFIGSYSYYFNSNESNTTKSIKTTNETKKINRDNLLYSNTSEIQYTYLNYDEYRKAEEYFSNHKNMTPITFDDFNKIITLKNNENTYVDSIDHFHIPFSIKINKDGTKMKIRHSPFIVDEIILDISKMFTVIFEANGGNPAPEQQTITWGEKIIQPNATTKDGYLLSGWYIDNSFTNKWNFDIDVVTGNMTLYAKWVTPTVVPGSDYIAKMRWLDSNVQSDGFYTFEFDSEQTISSINLSDNSKKNITFEFKGIGIERIINYIGSGIRIRSGDTLILNDKINFKGDGSNNNTRSSSIIITDGGTLIQNFGAKLSRNISIYVESNGRFIMNGGEISGITTSTNDKGSVYVEGNGHFIMNSGKITGNYNNSGGGVYITNSYKNNGRTINIGGNFIINGGEITGNSAWLGGGVYNGGIFTMTGGIISGNTTTFGVVVGGGGGVYVDGGGIFTMTGGVISNNTTVGNGGGIYISRGIFVKTGGTIFGYSENDINSNAVIISSFIFPKRGHTVYISHSNTLYNGMGKDTTSGPTDNLSYDATTNPPKYSGSWEY